MRRQIFILISISCLYLLTACSGDPSAPAPSEARVVKGTFRSAPSLAVYREVNEPEWKPLPMITPTSFEFSPKAPYLVTVVCEEGDETFRFAFVQQVAQTPDDPGELDLWCERNGPHLVTGSFHVPGIWGGWVSMGGKEFLTSGGAFEFLLNNGTYDFLYRTSADTNKRLIIRRGIEVSGNMALTPLQVDLEGVPLITPHFAVLNVAPMEQIAYVSTLLEVRDGAMKLHGSTTFEGNPIPVAPNHMLLPLDVQTVSVFARSGQRRRGVARKFREGDSTLITLPDHVDTVTLSQTDGRFRATWAALPKHDRIRAHLFGNPADSSTLIYCQMTVSWSFEDTMGISMLELDAAIPGYQPRWLIDVSKLHEQTWYAERDVGNDTLMSGASISVNDPMMSAGPPLDHHYDLRPLVRGWRAP